MGKHRMAGWALVVAMNVGACAATNVPPSGAPRVTGRMLACDSRVNVYDYGDSVAVRAFGVDIETTNGWRDPDGRHFAVWVLAADKRKIAIEIVFPNGAPDSAVARVFELDHGQTLDVIAGADGVWRIQSEPTHVASCGDRNVADAAVAVR